MSSLEHFNELDLTNIFGSVNPPQSSVPTRLPSNTSLLQTGALSHHPSHTNYTHYALAQHRRFLAAAVPRTPALKPSKVQALETSPITPGVTATNSYQPPAPLHLPVAASDAGPVLPDPQAAGVYVNDEAQQPLAHARAQRQAQVMRPQVPADLIAPGPGAVQALLKWVTREPVVLSGSYRPGNCVEKAFDAVRAGAPNALDAAMSQLYNDVSQYVDKKKERKRHAHKSRLRQVEHRLTMEQREVARHRIEASLTKFKKTENEKALRSAMRWMGEQIANASPPAL